MPVPGAAVDVPVVAVASTTPVAKVWLLLVAEIPSQLRFKTHRLLLKTL